MSDERRKLARTQGRFSDGNRNVKEKKCRAKNGRSKVQVSPSANVPVLYQEDTKYSGTFTQFEDKKKPIEIKTGRTTLSSREEGESRVYYDQNFISEEEAETFMTDIHNTIKWNDKNIVIHGEEIPQPRLVAWFGPFPYSYSGAILEAAEMPPLVQKIKELVEEHLRRNGFEKVIFNSVLLNLYRDGKDSVAWHSDNEMSMGIDPTIASVSLGEVRKFEIKPKREVKDSDTRFVVNLTPGSLLVMDGIMQNDWMHRVPKEFHDKGPRINLTFRTVYSLADLPKEVPFKKEKTWSSNNELQDGPKLSDTDFPILNNGETKQKSAVKKNLKDLTDTNPVVSESDANISYQSENNMLDVQNSNILQVATEISNIQCSEPSSDSSSTETGKEQSKSQLNANAPDFVPQTSINRPTNFRNFSYENFSRININDVGITEMGDLNTALIETLHLNQQHFSDRDWFELHVYMDLAEIGQTNDGFKVINKRIISLIRRNLSFKPKRWSTTYNRYH